MKKNSREKFKTKVAFRKGDNLRFIADYLLKRPGSTMTEVRRALCEFRNKAYSRGQYAKYFAKAYYREETSYVDTYWYKREGGWYLTLAGYGLATVDPRKRLA